MRILIAVTCYKGFCAIDHASSVQRLLLASQAQQKPIDWLYATSVGCAVLPRARNGLVAQALHANCDAILFIDDDIGFEPDDVFRMIGHGVGVVGAVPQKRNHKWDDPPKLAIAPHGLRLNKETGLALPPEPKLPMALTLIACQVFRDIRAAGLAEGCIYPSLPDKGMQQHMATYFGYELTPVPDYSKEYELAQELGIEDPKSEDGEDQYFCRRAAACGWDTLIDTEVELRHWEGQVCHNYSFKKLMADGSVELKPEAANAA